MSVTEDYVSFETAKLLKEKGFDEYCLKNYWNTDKELHDWGWELSYHRNSDGNRNTKDCAAPTLQMAMKWLREVHNLHICIFIGEDSSCDTDGNTVDMWHFWSYNVTNLCGDMVYDAYDKFDCVEYQSYEGAVEAAIKYCLTNLI